VRQLENAVARMVALTSTPEIAPEAFGDAPAKAAPELDADSVVEGALSLREYVDAIERNLVIKALAVTGGNQTEAARRLGLSRTALIDRLKRFNLG
jgi:two-component system response regulator AtoC